MARETTGETTVDAVSGGALRLRQSRGGYRFGTDALLLATDLPPLEAGATVVDLGAGQGAVGLAIASRRPDLRVVCVERQPTLLEHLRHNVQTNGLDARVEVIAADVREMSGRMESHIAHLVVCNPPYRRAGDGRVSPNVERAEAHRELHGDLADFVRAAAYLARPRGRAKILVPPPRLACLFGAVEGTDLDVESLRSLHARPQSDAWLVEARLRRGGAPELVIPPPLVMHPHGADTLCDEARRRIEGAATPHADV